MSIFVVLNPVAGRARAADVRAALTRAFDSSAQPLDIYETTGREQLHELVKDAINDGARLVIAAGGDGTVSAVVDGVANTGVPLGIIPTGTGNVFAQELDIPLGLDKACRLLAGDHGIKAVDALQIGERFYVLSVGTGADAQAIQLTGREGKRRFGPLAYVWAALKVVVGVQPRHYTIVADGQRTEVRAADVLVTNIATMTGPLRWGRHIRPDDGQVDICIMRAANFFDFFRVAWDILTPGRPHRKRNMRYLAARESVVVTADRPMPVQGDGELLGETPLEIQVAPGAVNVMVPGDEDVRRWTRL